MPIEVLARRLLGDKAERQPYFHERRADWAIHINKRGTKFVSCVRLEPPVGQRGAAELSLPSVTRSNNTMPLLFADTAMLTLPPVHHNDESLKLRAKREAHLALMARCAASTKDDAAAAVVRALQTLEKLDPATAFKWPDDIKPKNVMVFYWEGAPVCQRPAVSAFWQQYQRTLLERNTTQCLACGAAKPVLRKIAQQLKGIVGSLQGQAALVSANTTATFSGGLRQALCSPICAGCADAFTKSFQGLMVRPENHVRLGRLDLVFWTEPSRPGIDSNIAQMLRQPTAAINAQILLQHGLDGVQVHILGMSAQQRRAVVRIWQTLPAGELIQNLTSWYVLQAQVSNTCYPLASYKDKTAKQGARSWWPGLLPALHISGDDREVPISWIVTLVDCALHGTLVPDVLVQQMMKLQDLHIDNIGQVFLALAKKDERMIDVVAWRCGALFSFLGIVQRSAVGRLIKRTVADRLLHRAVEHPKVTLGQVLREAHAHLRKLERAGSACWLRRKLDELLNGLVIPERFTPGGQTDFMLGYWEANLSRDRKREEPPAETPPG